jgi:hypothetical protein
VPSFDKVVDIESRVFSSKLFEVIRLRIQDQSKVESMPFEEQELQQMRQETVRFAHNLIKEKLGSILDCRSLVELATDFETRIY